MTLREIKRRIKAVEGTKKITRAMGFVATVESQKMHAKFINAQHFFLDMNEFLKYMSCDFYSLEKEKKCLIFIASNKGLCGSYNINIARYVLDLLNKIKAEKIIGVGNTGLNIAKKNNIELDISEMVIDLYKNNYEIYFVYTKFYSSVRLLPVYKKILPLEKSNRDILFEPDKDVFIDMCLKKFVKYIVYGMLLESSLCVQSSRMISMKAATDNADEMLKKLKLKYNMIRQSKITQELIEIISGANKK